MKMRGTRCKSNRQEMFTLHIASSHPAHDSVPSGIIYLIDSAVDPTPVME